MCYLAMGMSQPYYSYPMRMPQPSTPFRVRVMSRAKARARPIARVTVRFMISGRVRIRTKVQGRASVSHIHTAVMPQSCRSHAAVMPQSYHSHLDFNSIRVGIRLCSVSGLWSGLGLHSGLKSWLRLGLGLVEESRPEPLVSPCTP